MLIGGTAGLVLLFVRRQPQFLLHTSEYALAVLANYPDPDTVQRFLHRLGYREIAGRPVKPAPPEAEPPKT
jgi:hypothetical protein